MTNPDRREYILTQREAAEAAQPAPKRYLVRGEALVSGTTEDVGREEDLVLAKSVAEAYTEAHPGQVGLVCDTEDENRVVYRTEKPF